MNYYERIQCAINFMEENLENEIKVEDIAKNVYMSESGMYRLFFAITGYQVKDYFIRRRMSCAFEQLRRKDSKVIDVAFQYSYNSVDAFTRIFKKITGYTPSTCAKGIYQYKFERMNVMEKYFESDDKERLEEYPDIRVISNLPEMRVAYYCYYGKDPETGAFSVMKDWVLKQGLDYNNGNYRIFGYNAPDTDASAEEYGYEVCITIPKDMKVEDELVKVKTLPGGRYAVTSIAPKDDLGTEIMNGWQRFMKWLEGSRYAFGNEQWLEEHLNFSKDFEHIGGVDLYMPIIEKESLNNTDMTEEKIEPFYTVVCEAFGKGAESKARKYLFAWMKENGFNQKLSETRVFAYYNFERVNKPDFCYRICVSVPQELEITDEKLKKELFPGGLYLVKRIKYQINATSWFQFMHYMEQNTEYGYGSQPFMEEYQLTKLAINNDTPIIQRMPVVKKSGL